MKILLATESYWPNADGGAFFERRLVLGLAQRGNEVAVWAPGSKFKSYIEVDGTYPIYRERSIVFLINKKYRVSFMPFWHARHVIEREKPDVIHIHNCSLIGLSALFWARRKGIPVVATNHFMPENALLNFKGIDALYNSLHRLIWSYLVWFHNRVDFVTSPTPTAVKLLTDHGLRAPAEAISNGIDTNVFKSGLDATAVKEKYGIKNDRPVVLYVGRLDGEKRLDLIVSAIPLIKKQQKLQVVFCGFGNAMDSLKQQAKRLGVEDDLLFTGYIEEEDKPLVYNAADVFVISSPAELQSIVTLEAMASGLPVVAVDVAALKELCHDGENGFLFPRDDVPALADRIQRILSDKSLAKRFSEESKRIVHDHHTTEVMFEHYEQVYRRAMRRAS